MPPHASRRAGAGGGMDDALRQHQHLQFCRQLEALQAQLCEETYLSGELLASVYALGKYCATPASPLAQLAAAFPEFAAKLQRLPLKPHPLKELHMEQMEGEAVGTILANAEALASVLQPIYRELQDLGKFLVRATGLLADLHQLLITVTMATAPGVIEFLMTLFANTARIALLAPRVPWRLLVQVRPRGAGGPRGGARARASARRRAREAAPAARGRQVYTIVTTGLDGSSPPGRTAVCELLERLAEPVAYLQEVFAPIAPRVSQARRAAPRRGRPRGAPTRAVPSPARPPRPSHASPHPWRRVQILELAVSAALDHVACAAVLERSSVFDVSRLGQTQLGVTGLSPGRTYAFLTRIDDFRAWAALGLLACPAALQGVHAQPLLTSLLSESFLLPLHGDVALPLHALFAAHVTPALEGITAARLDAAGARRGERSAALADARALVARCYDAAARGAEAEHAARRRFAARVLGDMLAVLNVRGGGGARCCAGSSLPRSPAHPPSHRHAGPPARQDDAGLLPEALPMALAAAAYAKSELLWYFRHAGERLPGPPPPAGGAPKLGLLGGDGGPAAAPLAEDGHVAVLAAALTGLVDLLEEHAALLQGHQLATMRALLEQQVLPETAAVLAAADRSAAAVPATGRERLVPRILVPLIKGVVYPLAELAGAEDAAAAAKAVAAGAGAGGQPGPSSRAAAQGDAGAGGCDEGEAPHSPAAAARAAARVEGPAVLASVQRCMVHLTMLLSSRNLWMRPAVLEAPAQDPQYLEALHRLLELVPFATAFLPALEGPCGLGQLVHHQRKLLALAQHVLAAPSLDAAEQLAALPAIVKVLPWFEHNPPVVSADGEARRDYGGEARALASRLLEEAATTAAAPGSRARARAGGGDAPASARARAVALAAALDALGPVAVARDRVVVPGEYLRGALQQCLVLAVDDMVAAAEVPPVPSRLARSLSDLLWAAGELSAVLRFDARPELWQVLLNHAQPGWVLPPRGAPPGSEPGDDGDATGGGAGAGAGAGVPMRVRSVVASYGSWLLSAVVRDVHGLGVMYAPQARRFTCVSPGGRQLLHSRASLPELAALLQVFGPYAAQQLAEATEGAVLDALAGLDESLARWQEVLDPVTMAVVVSAGGRSAAAPPARPPLTARRLCARRPRRRPKRDDSCADAVAAACSALADEAAVLTHARALSRCLALRQLLGEALAQALGAAFPVAAATIEAVAANAALDVTGGAAAAAAPPFAATPAAGAPSRQHGASELLAGRHVCDVFELPRPGLGGVGSPVVADPLVVATLVGSNNYERYRAWYNLPALLGLCLNSAALGASALSVPDHALASELHALVHAAKCLVLAQQQAANRVLTCGSADDPVAVRTSKQLLLESLACPQLPTGQLADAWLPASRIRSGLCQAVL
ncbi:hypothetical protein HT031_003668 [Scenedesmus sp. PABB004]|nr:hypothetical protein HT031_003668 [Scenedesmus sp. PABB004]